MKNISISKKISIPFEFMLSVVLSSVMFLFVLGIVAFINNIMVSMKDTYILTESIIETWSILKAYIMYLDIVVIGLYVTIEFSIWLKELYLFAKEELFEKGGHHEK